MKLPERKPSIYFNIELVKEYVDTSYGTSVKNHGNQESKRGFQTGLIIWAIMISGYYSWFTLRIKDFSKKSN